LNYSLVSRSMRILLLSWHPLALGTCIRTTTRERPSLGGQQGKVESTKNNRLDARAPKIARANF